MDQTIAVVSREIKPRLNYLRLSLAKKLQDTYRYATSHLRQLSLAIPS